MDKQAAELINQGWAVGFERGLSNGWAKGLSESLAENIAPGVAERIAEDITETIAKGIAEGVAMGISEGKADLLLRLLAKRFGKVTPAIRERVENATVADLDAWAIRIFDASSPKSVLGEKSRA